MNVIRYLMIVATLGLAACEQVQVFGPIGGGTITVTEVERFRPHPAYRLRDVIDGYSAILKYRF